MYNITPLSRCDKQAFSSKIWVSGHNQCINSFKAVETHPYRSHEKILCLSPLSCMHPMYIHTLESDAQEKGDKLYDKK